MINWKVGDWAIHGYDIVQVKTVEPDGRVTDVSDGHFSCGSWDVRDMLRPLTLKNKSIAMTVDYKMNELHRHKRNNLLNFPDIARKAEELSINIIDGKITSDTMYEFFNKINEILREPSIIVQDTRVTI